MNIYTEKKKSLKEDEESWPFRRNQVALHFFIILQRKIVFYILILFTFWSARTNHAVPRGIANRSITCTDFDSKRLVQNWAVEGINCTKADICERINNYFGIIKFLIF